MRSAIRSYLTSGRLLVGPLLVIGLASCASTPDHDYTAFIEHAPVSILVLPPLNESPEADVCYPYLATVTNPLIEHGYYVFPVALVDRIMRDNGLPTPYEMHQVPMGKLIEIFDPDAVLYLTVTDWGSSYQVISSVTTVSVSGLLVDAASGVEIWRGAQVISHGSGDSGGGLLGALITAAVSQVGNSLSDPSTAIAQEASIALFTNSRSGLLPGPYHGEHEERMAAVREAAAAKPAD